MAMTPEQLTSIVAMAVQQALAAQALVAQSETRGHGGGGGTTARNERKVLEEREFRRMEKFAGGEDAWREWEFDFRTAVRACSTHTANAMEQAEKEGGPCTGEMLELSIAGNLYPEMAKRSTELFEVLCGLLTSEAKMMIREIP